MNNITIYDVAREASVSMATVSRVVNGNPNVKPVTRKKVMDVIDRLGYRPNAVARGLASKKTTTVGLIIPDISNIFFAELVRGIEDIATMYKYNIILSNSDENTEKELHLLNTMLGKQVDGLIFMGSNITKDHITEFKKYPVPIVLAGSIEDSGEKMPPVNIDYEQSAYDSVNFFISNGHTKIALIIGNREELISLKKLAGYKKALEEKNIPFKEEYIVEGDFSYDSGIEAANRLSELDEKPTAVLVGADEMAVGVVNAIQDNGFKVPNDLEVISFDNTKLTLMVRPQVTTVVQPLYDIGAVAMRLLTKLMNKEEVEERSVVLPHRIEERNSTK